MGIPVILKDGQERSVDKEELQFLFLTRRVLFFRRAEGWVVVGRDPMRSNRKKFPGQERRHLSKYSREYWY